MTAREFRSTTPPPYRNGRCPRGDHHAGGRVCHVPHGTRHTARHAYRDALPPGRPRPYSLRLTHRGVSADIRSLKGTGGDGKNG